MKECRRCKKVLEEQLFFPEITMCIPCYSTQGGNFGLTYEELAMKAKRSRGAIKRKYIENQALILRQMGMTRKVEEQIANKTNEPLHPLDPISVECEHCGSETIEILTRPKKGTIGEYILICKACDKLRDWKGDFKDEALS